MKRKLNLRSVKLKDYAQQRTLAYWRDSGYELPLNRPAEGLLYITFWAQGSQGLWQGGIQLRQWIANVLPQLSELLPGKVADEDVLALFSAAAQPIEIDAELLDYNRLFGFSLIDGAELACGELPVIATAQCLLWLLSVPAKVPRRQYGIQPWLQRLPLTLRCSLGTSILTEKQLKRLAPGDVVRIEMQVNVSIVADRYAGLFTIVKEGLSMQQDTGSTNSLLLDGPLSDISVKLEFVLEERTISLLELNELMTGTVLSLDVESIREIEIRVGGRAIAMGELIQMDDSLGVELREVFTEATHE